MRASEADEAGKQCLTSLACMHSIPLFLCMSAIYEYGVSVSFVDESDFQKEEKWFFLSKNSQFEACSTVPLDINGSLAGMLDLGEDKVSEAGSDSGGISSHDGSKNDTDSDYITEPSTIAISSSSFNRKEL